MARRKVIIIIALVAVALLAGLFLLLPARKPALSWTLPDGSKLRLLKVTYGTTNHIVDYGHSLKDLLFPLVPAKYRQKFNFQTLTLSVPPPGGLIVWFERSGINPAMNPPATALPIGSLFSINNIRVFDETGNESPPYTIYRRTLTNKAEIIAVMLNHYPRRAKTIGLRIYESAAPTAKLLAEFQVRNPAPQHPHEWAPEPLPATRRTNDLELTLLRLESDPLTPDSASPGGRPNQSQIHAAFEVRESGNTATNWSIAGITFSNVLGESFSAQYPATGAAQNLTALPIAGRFWAEDPAWVMHVELGAIGGQTPDATWTINGLELPNAAGPAPASMFTNLTTNLLGVQVTLTNVQMTGAAARTARGTPPAKILSLVFEAPASLWLGVPQVLDEQGQPLQPRGTTTRPPTAPNLPGNRPRQQIFRYTVPEGTKTVNVTVGASHLVAFEFLVRPTAASSPSPDPMH
jgi:hypothetical protein